MSIKMLLIDDNADQILITRRALANNSPAYQIASAQNAQERIGKLKIEQFDVVLCDYRLPDMSGLEVLRRLKSLGNEPPFILVTSVGNEQVAVEAMKLGASDYVVKDSLYEEILPKVIQQSLDRYRERKEREELESERNKAIEDLKLRFQCRYRGEV